MSWIKMVSAKQGIRPANTTWRKVHILSLSDLRINQNNFLA